MADATDIPFDELPEWAKPTWARTTPATITASPVSSSDTLVNPPSRGLTGTQLGAKVSEGAADAWKSLTTKPEWLTDAERPLQQTPQQRLVSNAKQMQLANAVTPPAVENENAVIPRTTPEKVVAGGVQAIGDLADSFQTPLGAATLGIGGLPRIAQKAVAGAFSAYMAKQTPEIAKQLGDEFGKNADQRDPQKIAKLVTDAGLNTAFSVAGALHAAGMEAPPASPKETISATPMVPPEKPPVAKSVTPVAAAVTPVPEIQTSNQFPLGKGPIDISVPQKVEAPVAPPQTTVLPESGKAVQPVSDFEQYQTLVKSLSGKSIDQAFPILKQLEAIKNRNGGMAPKPPSEPAPPSSPPPTIAKPPAVAPTAGGAYSAPKPNIRQQAKSFTDLVKEHAETQKWAQGQTLDYLHTPHPGKTNLGTMGIKGAMAIGKATKVALRNAAKDLGLDPDQIGKESYRAKHLDKLQAFIAKQQPQKLPQLRPGEKGTGDLLQSEQPFNLAGEKGVDTERAAREQRARLAEARANEQFQAKHQQQFIPQGPGGKTYAASTRPDEPPETYEGTALKNAVANFERAIHGYPEAPPTEKRDMAIQFENARETLHQDHDAGSRLADRLIANPTMGLTDEQSAVLLHHKVDTETAINAAAEKTWTSKTPDEKIAAQLEYARLNEHFKELLDAVHERGSHWGREGRWRQALAFEDYSFVSREKRLRAANGGEMTEKDMAGLQARVSELQKNMADMKANEQAQIDAAVTDALRKVAQNAQPKIPPYIVQIAEKIGAKLHAQADESRAYLRGKTFTVSPDVLYHLSRIGADAIYETGLDFAKWSAKMIGEFGDKIKPHLQDVFAASQKVVEGIADAETAKQPAKVKSQVKSTVAKTPDEKIDAIKVKISDNLKKNKKNSVSVYVQRLARLFYENGVRGRNGIVDAVHKVMKDINPYFKREETVRAFSGYGEFSPLSKEAATVALRGYKGELQQVEKLRDMAQGIPPHKTGIERRTPTEAEKKLIQAVNRAKVKFQVPITDPATQLKSALDTRKSQLETQIKDYTDRLANNEFTRPPRRELKLDRRAAELTVERNRIKQKFDDAERNAMLKNRPTYQKVLDFFTKFLRREFVLSSPVSIGKLTMAALHGLTLEPIKEAVGAGVAKALPGFASRLKTEAPSSVKIEAKALASAFTNTARDAAQTIRTSKSDLEMRYGGRKAVPEEMVSYFGRLHAALKTPLKRAAFERIYAKLAEQELRAGNDARDVLVDMRIGNLAMKEANRMLYLEDNKLVSAYQRFLSAFEQKDPATGKPSPTGTIAAGALRWMLPIVRIPTNLIARTIQSAVGLEAGIGKLAYAYAKGIQELPQEHADLIMRQLKGGSIGTAFLLYGYFNAAQFGGFYQPGEKRKEGELKPAQMSIGGVVIPAWAMHRQEFLAMQLGATIYKVAHSKIRKADTDNAGIGEGAMAGILGLTSETPMVNETLETSRMFNKYERDQYLDQQAANFVNPQFVQWVARQMDKQTPFSPTQDTTQRKATNLKEAFEMGIPGMRQNVPAK